MKKVWKILTVEKEDDTLRDLEWGENGYFDTEEDAQAVLEDAMTETDFEYDRGICIVPFWVKK